MSRNWAKEYFTFTYKERIGLIALLLLIVIVFLLPEIIPAKEWKASQEEIAAFQKLASALQKDSLSGEVAKDNDQAIHNEPSIQHSRYEPKLFPFDPNTISYKQWQQLGVRDKTIITIQKYLSKGGRFRHAEDLQKIYGFGEKEFERLRSYVRIVVASNVSTEKSFRDSFSTTHAARVDQKYSIVALNDVDTSALIQLPGIGSRLANRIIRFRDKLGGFYSVEQVAETYGLPDSTFQRIKPFLILGTKQPVQININQADLNRLREHPYIGWTMARSLLEYRAQHGPFKAIEDVLQVSSISADHFKRLIPYLSTY